jgi:hypothetical protein
MLQTESVDISMVRARCDELLMETAEEGLLADLSERPTGRQPIRDLALPSMSFAVHQGHQDSLLENP